MYEVSMSIQGLLTQGSLPDNMNGDELEYGFILYVSTLLSPF